MGQEKDRAGHFRAGVGTWVYRAEGNNRRNNLSGISHDAFPQQFVDHGLQTNGHENGLLRGDRYPSQLVASYQVLERQFQTTFLEIFTRIRLLKTWMHTHTSERG